MSILFLWSSLAWGRTVSLSNTALPLDTNGTPLITGEMSVLPDADGSWVLYFNDWGGCPGIDCCTAAKSTGCSTCCFTQPPGLDPCVYTANHTVVAYRTPDFSTFTPLGAVLPPSARRPGVEFRPQVILCPATGTYVMWYEDRWTGGVNGGYAVAHATSPAGPFVTVSDSVKLPGLGRVGDYDIFTDSKTNTSWHVRTGLTIVPLASNCSAPEENAVATEIRNMGVEGPAMFQRGGIYYLLVGVACCACKGGSNVIVYTAPAPAGPWTLGKDVGSNTTDHHVFNSFSPYNYVTRAQQTKVITVPTGDTGAPQYLWIGNAWVTSGGPRNSDLLYFSILNFTDASGEISQMIREDECLLSVP